MKQLVDGNNYIAHHLKHGKTFAAGKIGVTELNLLYAETNNPVNVVEHLRHEVENIAGMYPYTTTNSKRFYDLFVNALTYIDLIPQWSKLLPEFEDHTLTKYCKTAHRTKLQHLEPYFFDNPWTDQLVGKKVLVVSPFAKSIEANYKKLGKIWKGKIKPNFELITLNYPHSLAIEKSEKYQTSFDILEDFQYRLFQTTFDVAIIGTGHTSLILTAHCRKMGKSAIHLGGPTQILFGIRGGRWNHLEQFQPFFNEHWTIPLPEETPRNKNLVEGGCYW